MSEFGCPSRCDCQLRARCEYHHCGAPADWSVFIPPTRKIFGPHGRLMFMCEPCRAIYTEVFKQPLKGIDRPEGVDEDWRPSLMDHLKFASIEREHELRHSPVIPKAKRDPAWLVKVDRMFAPTPARESQP